MDVSAYYKHCQILYEKCGQRFSVYRQQDEYSATLNFNLNKVRFINTLYDFPASDHPKATVEVILEPNIQCYKAVLINEDGEVVQETAEAICEIIAAENKVEAKNDRLSAV